LLPATYFHRLTIKQLMFESQRRVWARHPCFDPAGEDVRFSNGFGSTWTWLSGSPLQSSSQGSQAGAVGPSSPSPPLHQLEREGRGLPQGGKHGKHRVVPCCPSISASPGKGRGSWPQQPRWAASVGQEHAPRHRGPLAEANTSVTPGTSGDFCSTHTTSASACHRFLRSHGATRGLLPWH